MDTGRFASKTYSPVDLAEAPAAPLAGALQRFALRLGLSGVPFAVNGVLRRRFFLRRHKLWEYSRGVACVLATSRPSRPRVLDFGGGATLPVFYLARCGCEVFSLDIDAGLAEATNAVARRRGWRLLGSTHDLSASPPPPEWGLFDAVILALYAARFLIIEGRPTLGWGLVFMGFSIGLFPEIFRSVDRNFGLWWRPIMMLIFGAILIYTVLSKHFWAQKLVTSPADNYIQKR